MAQLRAAGLAGSPARSMVVTAASAPAGRASSIAAIVGIDRTSTRYLVRQLGTARAR